MTKDEIFEEDVLNEEAEDDDALTLDDLSVGYIGNPKVGEHINIKVKKITKMKGDQLMGKTKEGKTFNKGLSGVDYGYEVITEDGSKYTVSSWEVFGKMKSIFQKIGFIKDVELEIEHLCNGLLPENKDKDKYKVSANVDGTYKTLDRETKEWDVE